MTYLLGLATGLAVWFISRKLRPKGQFTFISRPGDPFPVRRWWE